MRITFPLMGYLHVGASGALRMMGREPVIPPMTPRTIDLGTRYSHEMGCIPLKMNLANMIEALEMGADTIVVIGGDGPCRFGYYGEEQRRILESLGYEFEMIFFHQETLLSIYRLMKRLSGGKPISVIKDAFKFFWRRLLAIEEVMRAADLVRHREIEPGSTTRLQNLVIGEIERTDSFDELERVRASVTQRFEGLNLRRPFRAPRVGLVGEIYIVLEPMVNMDVKERLAALGVEVHQGVGLCAWINHNIGIDAEMTKDWEETLDAGYEFLRLDVGGDSANTVGRSARFARDGFDGIVHLAPFTCMPEAIAQTVLAGLGSKYDIPILTLIFDEMTGEAGVQTRLEAFVDLVKKRGGFER